MTCMLFIHLKCSEVYACDFVTLRQYLNPPKLIHDWCVGTRQLAGMVCTGKVYINCLENLLPLLFIKDSMPLHLFTSLRFVRIECDEKVCHTIAATSERRVETIISRAKSRFYCDAVQKFVTDCVILYVRPRRVP